MIENKKCLAVIVARGGSKGLPGKNLADLGGRSLLSWTIEAAKGANYLDQIILSSDEDVIMDEARRWNCKVPFRRPKELATDESPVSETIIHALDHTNGTYDYVVLLQATSPFRTAQDIDACVELCHRNAAPSAIAVTGAPKPSRWIVQMDENTHKMSFVIPHDDMIARRQDLPSEYVINGAVYVADVSWYRKQQNFLSADTLAYVMPKERSIDIDDWIDLCVARAIIVQITKNQKMPEPQK